jgi:alginate O-acetyltransferase complex protein AlgI
MGTGTALNSNTFQFLQLHSFHFLAVCVAAVVLLRLFPRGPCRGPAILALNLYFIFHFVNGWEPFVLLLALVGFAYFLGRSGLLRERLPSWAPLAGVLVLWALLFLVKDPALLSWFNPFYYHPIALVGVSYMVFRCIQFVMDGEFLGTPSLLGFLNYVFFFPTLLAGPLDRYEHFEQFHKGEGLDLNESPLPALHRMANGFFKKFVLSDTLVGWSLSSLSPGETWPVPLLWVGLLLLPVVLYLDFSGYCDIMIGLGRLLGYRLPENFDAPWKAANIQDFWNRWHMTLSHFIRDYVFAPLSRQVFHLFSPRWHLPALLGLYLFTMTLLGLWHGTTLTFLLFGLAHGVMLVLVQIHQRIVTPRLPARVSEYLKNSRLVYLVSWGGNYLFIASTIALWSLGVDGFWTVTRQLTGV